jgi:hypothetical protein
MERLKVAIRLRPFLSNENESNTGINMNPDDDRTIMISKSLKTFKGTFDKILSTNSTQKDVFNFIKPCVYDIKKGINCTILAYGQTGSGKTYTMLGGDWSFSDSMKQNNKNKTLSKDEYNFLLNKELVIDPFSETNGIIPNLIMQLFNIYNNNQNSEENNNLLIKCSYIQVYNEQIYDLLEEIEQNEQKKKFDTIMYRNRNEKLINQTPLKLKNDKINGIIIEGVKEIETPTFFDIFDVLSLGETNRKIRHTNKNDMSSRSHTIFIINIQNIKSNVVSKIKLCDLAGSERYDSRESYKKLHFNEMCNINKSLLVLGNVIHSLGQINSNTTSKSPNKKNKNGKTFAPYKDSKLTQILEDSIGGNSLTYLIANISPCTENFEETISTLKFADRAHSIMSEVSMNQLDNKDESVNSKEFNKLREELFQLKQLLNIRRKRGTLEPIQEELLKLKDENTQLKKFLGGENNVNKIQELMVENNNLRKEIKNLRNINQNLKNEINSKPNSQISSEFNDNLKNNFSAKKKSKLNNDIYSNNKSSSLKNLNNNTNKDSYLKTTVNDVISTPKNNNKNKVNRYDIDDMLESNETEKNQNKNKMSKNNKYQKSGKNVLLESGQNIVYGTKEKDYEKSKNNNEDNEINNMGDYDINDYSKNNKSKKNTNVSKNKNLNQLSDIINSSDPYENLDLLDQIDIDNNNNSNNEEVEEGGEGGEGEEGGEGGEGGEM